MQQDNDGQLEHDFNSESEEDEAGDIPVLTRRVPILDVSAMEAKDTETDTDSDSDTNGQAQLAEEIRRIVTLAINENSEQLIETIMQRLFPDSDKKQ